MASVPVFAFIISVGLLVVLSVLIGGAAFIYIDRIVAKRLATGEEGPLSAIVSDSLRFRANQNVDPAFFKQLLTIRNYHSSDSDTLSAGDFHESPDRLQLVTRAYTDADGSLISATPVTLDKGKTSTSFSLEPEVLVPLGAKEIRASQFVRLQDTPSHLVHALLSIEDERFYSHFGIDPIGIARAVFTNVSSGRLVQGGSTLTQQLAKNLFFTARRSLLRKLLEIPAALSLEMRLSKNQILEMYLNEVYLGQDGAVAIHGMGEGAKAFFGKPASKLTLAESALLAGIIQAPSAFAPRKNPDRAMKRRNLVLDKMKELGHISEAECNAAKAVPVKVIADPGYAPKMPFFSNALKEELDQQLNFDALVKSGVKIYTGIRPDYQRCAEEAVANGISNLEKTYPRLKKQEAPLEASFVAIEPYSGKVQAWVGGRSFERSQFDRVSKSKRPIGSTIKPFVYITALDETLNSYKTATAISILRDEPIEIPIQGRKSWSPENYDHEYHGDVTLRYALEHSLNIPAVYISQRFGVNSLVKVLESFEVQKNISPVPSLALGALETSLLKLTAAYATFANGGIHLEPRLFVSARDADLNQLATSRIDEARVANEAPTFVLTSILEGVIERGTATAIRKAGYTGPAAGKTGTTNDARDAWFVGYNSEVAAGVWVGFDDNTEIGLTGGAAAAPIWGAFMKCANKNREFEPFIPPSSVVLLDVDPVSGLRFGPDCPGTGTKEFFVRGTEPRSYCDSRTTREVPEANILEEAIPTARPKRERSFWDGIFGDE